MTTLTIAMYCAFNMKLDLKIKRNTFLCVFMRHSVLPLKKLDMLNSGLLNVGCFVICTTVDLNQTTTKKRPIHCVFLEMPNPYEFLFLLTFRIAYL